MMEKAYSVFLCVLLISVLLFPSTSAGRALLQTEQTEREGGNHGGEDRSKIDVHGSTSPNAHSKTRSSPPSEPIPVGLGTPFPRPSSPPVGRCHVYDRNCLSSPPVAKCTVYNRNCT